MSKQSQINHSTLTDDVVKPVVYEQTGINSETGVRADELDNSATEIIHNFTSAGRAIALSPLDIAEAILKGNNNPFTPSDIRDKAYHIRKALLKDAQRESEYGGTRCGMMINLNPNTGLQDPTCESVVLMDLSNTTAGNLIGKYGLLRLSGEVTLANGQTVTPAFRKDRNNNTTPYLDLKSFTVNHVEGFIASFGSLEDADERMEELRKALSDIRQNHWATKFNAEIAERNYDDNAPKNRGY